MVLRALIVVAMLGSVAGAQDGEPGAKPWTQGKTQAEQDQAFHLYDEANDLFAKGEYLKALEKYDAAIAVWDHPGIRYNRAVCLINLDRTVEAYGDLQLALRYGEEPLGKDLYNEGLNYQKLLARQVAELEIATKDNGAKISLDGKPLTLTGGRTTLMVAINAPHEITASKPGYQTMRKPLEHLPPGQTTHVDIRLELLERSKWKPWAVIAGGAVVGGLGFYAYSRAQHDIDTYEKAAEACPCASEAELEMKGMIPHDLPGSAHTKEVVAYSAFAIGGAMIVTGAVLVIRGRGHATHVEPAVGKDSMALTFAGRW